ncbi:hypothetical protein HPB47_010002 [Ixodes persulcatus]|uniref:Uncharacterized protein n=1 Tax=Ixodes persulcatus TaxID=34615 RepID=A0AC60P0D4_IXOPE|nr:hypothetical protein HPB47_010002 [Ixodes persulcatus]
MRPSGRHLGLPPPPPGLWDRIAFWPGSFLSDWSASSADSAEEATCHLDQPYFYLSPRDPAPESGGRLETPIDQLNWVLPHVAGATWVLLIWSVQMLNGTNLGLSMDLASRSSLQRTGGFLLAEP